MSWRDWIEALLRAALTVLVIAAMLTLAAPAKAADVEVFGKLGHVSDLFRGCPFQCEQAEPQLDYLAPLGVTITAGKRKAWEIDLSHGIKWIDRGKRESGSELAVRLYYGRLRGN